MQNKSILDRKISPFLQLGAISLLAVIMMGLSVFLPSVPYSSTNHIMPWVILCGMILFFSLVNSILSFSAEDGNMYWLHSIISFAILLVIGGLLAWAFSGVSIYEAGTVSWLYFVLTFGYLVFLSIVNLIKFFVKLAQKQDKSLRGEE
ncbi:MAG: hypothetical protein IPN86_18575 [Saprospiraceae bacterium]|nr:hypothetical protein [Saprospiraceae bacterium]